jgi:tripartite-type tricarboxylate transporter receptor subunit TctC
MKKLLFLLFLSTSLFAKDTIKIVVPYPAGGTSDKIARHIQNHFGNDEYNFVVENRSGAGGSVGATYVASEKVPTLLVSGQALITNSVLGNVKYDLENDFVFLSCMITDPLVIVTKADGQIKKFQDLKDMAKTKPVPYGTSGIGTVQNMLSPIIINRENNHIEVPFKGAPEVMNALLSDTIVWYVDILNLAAPLVESGKFILLASSDKLKKYPDVPTFKELGIDIHGFRSRQVFVANSAIDNTLKSYIFKKLNEDGMKQLLQQNGYESCINTNNPNALRIEKDIVKRIIK